MFQTLNFPLIQEYVEKAEFSASCKPKCTECEILMERWAHVHYTTNK